MKILFFIIPLALVNMFASLSRKFGFEILNKPLDFGFKINGKRLFGKNKTWRGAVFGTIAGIAAMYTISIMPQTVFDFSLYSPLIYGLLGGAGVIIGDALGSSIKRQLNIAPGKPLHIFDQLDWVIGSLIVLYPIVNLSLIEITQILLLVLVLHYAVNYTAYKIGMQDNKY